MTPEFTLRACRTSDESFIRNSWLKSLRNLPHFVDVPNAVFYDGMNKRIDELLKNSYVLVAADPEDDGIIWGYVVVSSTPLGRETVPVLHYLYVKQTFRGFGIAMKMLENVIGTEPEDIVFCTAWSPKMRDSKLTKTFRLTHNPFL